jgi:hypothetical protein
MHLFGRNCDHDYYFELLGEEGAYNDRLAERSEPCLTYRR